MDTMHGSQKDSDDSAATPQDETLEEVRISGPLTLSEHFVSDPLADNHHFPALCLSPAYA